MNPLGSGRLVIPSRPIQIRMILGKTEHQDLREVAPAIADPKIED